MILPSEQQNYVIPPPPIRFIPAPPAPVTITMDLPSWPKYLGAVNNVNDDFVCSSHSRTFSSILYASVTCPRLKDVCLSKSVSKRDDSRAIANGESENKYMAEAEFSLTTFTSSSVSDSDCDISLRIPLKMKTKIYTLKLPRIIIIRPRKQCKALSLQEFDDVKADQLGQVVSP